MKDLSHLSFLSHLKFFFFHFALNSFVFVLVYFVFFAHRTSARLNLNHFVLFLEFYRQCLLFFVDLLFFHVCVVSILMHHVTSIRSHWAVIQL